MRPKFNHNSKYAQYRPPLLCLVCNRAGSHAKFCNSLTKLLCKKSRKIKANNTNVTSQNGKENHNETTPELNVSYKNLLNVVLQVNGNNYIGLLDTGANLNAIREVEAQGLQKIKKPNTSFVITASGDRIPSLGMVKFNLKVGALETLISATIMKNLPYPIILGMEFLKKFNAFIDLKNNFVTLENKYVRTKVLLYRENMHNNLNKELSNVSYSLHSENRHSITDSSPAKRSETQHQVTQTQQNNATNIQCNTSFEQFQLENFDHMNSIVNCLITINTIRPENLNFPHAVWIPNQKCTEVLTIAVTPTIKFNLCYQGSEMNHLILWKLLQELKLNLHTMKTNKLGIKIIDNFTNLTKQSFINMVAYIFKDVTIDIILYNIQLSPTLTNIFPHTSINSIADNHNKTVEYALITPQHPPLIHPMPQHFKPPKVTLAQDYKIEPYTSITVNVETLTNQKHLNYNFSLNDNFLTKKKLLLEYDNQSPTKVKINSINNLPVVLFKGSTIGYLNMLNTEENKEKSYAKKVNKDFTDRKFNINRLVLSSDQQEKMNNLLKEYNDIFADDMSEIGRTYLLEHKIQLLKEAPFKSKPYRVSPVERETINKQLNEMYEQGIIRPSQSEYSSPIVLVHKKGEPGKTRFCVDYRKLNSLTVKSTYPISDLESILTYLGSSKYFSSIDLFSGFFQMPLEEKSKKYTAFITPGYGLWEFNCLPFGLCNAPSSFQQLTDTVLHGLKWSSVLCYLDDVIIFSETIEEHLDKLKQVFDRLRKANLTIKTSKCEFLKEEIKILGHIINKSCITPDPEKLSSIENFPIPINKKKLQSFIGLCSFYRKFIKDFSKIAKPLFQLLEKDKKYVWSSEQQKAFENLKDKLTKSPVLAHFNPKLDCELRADASRDGLGVILLQEVDGKMHPIAYASRTLTASEKNYPISELEALSVIYGLTYFRHFTYGRHVTIVTDHHSLCYLQKAHNTTGRLTRWLIKLQDFDYSIVYKSGKTHNDVDCLSRNPVLAPTSENEDMFEVPMFLLKNHDLVLEQSKDNDISDLIYAVNNPDDNNINISMRRRARNFRLIDNVLYKHNADFTGNDNLLVIPKHLVLEILHSHHSEPLAGHLGMNKTYSKISKRYYWVGMQKDVEKFVKTCPVCQNRKGAQNKKPQGLLQPIPVGTPFERVGIDMLGPFPKSENGNKVIVIATDYATRYVECEALPDSKSVTVAKFILNNLICRHSCFKYLHSDRAQNWRSELIQDLLKLMSINPSFTTSYHPQCNGVVEKFNLTMANMLSKYTDTAQKKWDQIIPHVTFAYNTSIHATTKFSPFFLVYGREAILPTEANLINIPNNQTVQQIREQILGARNLAVENIHNRQKQDKIRYDEKHRHVEFTPGEQVKIFYPKRQIGKSEKLLLKWDGPFYVIKKLNDVNYEIRKGNKPNCKTEVVHVSRILPYYEPYLPLPTNN